MNEVEFKAKIKICLFKNFMKNRNYKTGVRPNHLLPGQEDFFIGKIDFIDRDYLESGECCEAIGDFIVGSANIGHLKLGTSWHICEGNRIMGYATLLEDMSD